MRRAMAVAMALVCVLVSGCDLNPQPLPPFQSNNAGGTTSGNTSTETSVATASNTGNSVSNSSGTTTSAAEGGGGSENLGIDGAAEDAASTDATVEDTGTDAPEDAPDAGSSTCVDGMSGAEADTSPCADSTADSSALEDADGGGWSAELDP